MKKRMTIATIVVLTLIMLAACSHKEKTVSGDMGRLSESTANGSAMVTDAYYIRVAYDSSATSPTHTVIRSVDELANHIRNAGTSSFGETEYANVITRYTDAYFADNILVIVVLAEPSGSNRHAVESIDSNGTIGIKQLIPEIGTSDMAMWHILIPLDKRFQSTQFQIEFK